MKARITVFLYNGFRNTFIRTIRRIYGQKETKTIYSRTTYYCCNRSQILCIEITPMGVNKGVVRLKKVSFRNGIFIKMSERGLFGYTVHVSGFCHGGIDIQ